jgi:hypothetical protein
MLIGVTFVGLAQGLLSGLQNEDILVGNIACAVEGMTAWE